MSGTFERTMYDQKTYQTDLRQSTGTALYVLNPVSTNQCNPCREAYALL